MVRSHAAAHHEGSDGAYELRGPYPELEVNFPAPQPEEIRVQLHNGLVQDHLQRVQEEGEVNGLGTLNLPVEINDRDNNDGENQEMR